MTNNNRRCMPCLLKRLQAMLTRNAQQFFLAWVPFQRRHISLPPFFGFESVFLPIRQTLRILRPFHYLANALKTMSLLKAKRPWLNWVQLPGVPLLTIALQYKRIYDPGVRIIADCHNRILSTVLSDTPVTRVFYFKGGVFVDRYSPASIVMGRRAAIKERTRLIAEPLALRDERHTRWQTQAKSINEVLVPMARKIQCA